MAKAKKKPAVKKAAAKKAPTTKKVKPQNSVIINFGHDFDHGRTFVEASVKSVTGDAATSFVAEGLLSTEAAVGAALSKLKSLN